MASCELLFSLFVIFVSIGILGEGIHRFYEVLTIVRADVYYTEKNLSETGDLSQPSLFKPKKGRKVLKIGLKTITSGPKSVMRVKAIDSVQKVDSMKEVDSVNETYHHRNKKEKKKKKVRFHENVTVYFPTGNTSNSSVERQIPILLPVFPREKPRAVAIPSQDIKKLGNKTEDSKKRVLPSITMNDPKKLEDFSNVNKRTNKDTMTEEEVYEYIGSWILLGFSYLIILLCIQEIILSLFFWAYYYKQGILLAYWIAARSLCFFVNLIVHVLLCLAKWLSPEFPAKWELWLFTVICMLITIGGVVEYGYAIITLRRGSKTSERSGASGRSGVSARSRGTPRSGGARSGVTVRSGVTAQSEVTAQ